MARGRQQEFSKIKEVVAGWERVQELLRGGDAGYLVPVVIPRNRRAFAMVPWLGLALFSLLATVLLVLAGQTIVAGLAFMAFFGFAVLGGFIWWRIAIVEVEQGTTGIVSHSGKIVGTLPPGRRYLWWPWQKVEFIVDTSTEIPYTAPVLSAPTRENVPLKSIEFFLKFRIEEPVAFVRRIGASNFDTVLSSAVQDAIRQRSRLVETARAYDLRGSDVGDMKETLNRMLKRYGVVITGANIPDVQLPDQYRHNLATRERVAKELVAYEKEWELIRKRKSDALLLEIERAKKERDEKLIAVQEAINNARQRVAQSLQEVEAQAEKIRLDIEARGRAELKAAEDEATALSRLGRSYKDNQAVLQYELKLRSLDVAAELMQQAPRPVVVNSEGGEQSALTTLMLAQMLPNMLHSSSGSGGGGAKRSSRSLLVNGDGGDDDDEAGLQEQFTQLAKDVAARTASAMRGRRS